MIMLSRRTFISMTGAGLASVAAPPVAAMLLQPSSHPRQMTQAGSISWPTIYVPTDPYTLSPRSQSAYASMTPWVYTIDHIHNMFYIMEESLDCVVARLFVPQHDERACRHVMGLPWGRRAEIMAEMTGHISTIGDIDVKVVEERGVRLGHIWTAEVWAVPGLLKPVPCMIACRGSWEIDDPEEAPDGEDFLLTHPVFAEGRVWVNQA